MPGHTVALQIQAWVESFVPMGGGLIPIILNPMDSRNARDTIHVYIKCKFSMISQKITWDSSRWMFTKRALIKVHEMQYNSTLFMYIPNVTKHDLS